MDVTNHRSETVRAMVESAIQRYQIGLRPRVLFWTDWFRETCEDHEWRVPDWAVRMCAQSKRHLDQHRDSLRRLLDREHSVIALTVNRKIRRYMQHGSEPQRDDEYRTDEFYRRCVPGPKSPSVGFVLFPAVVAAEVDHPFLQEFFRRRTTFAVSAFANSLRSIDEAHLGGLLSNEAKTLLVEQPRIKSQEALAKIERPLLEG